MSPAVVHGSGGPAPTALLCAKRLWELACQLFLESVKGKSANIPIPGHRGPLRQPRYDPGDGTVDPRKEFSFLVKGSWDHGSESIELRWFLLPGQRRSTTPWGSFTVPTENPGEHLPRWLARTKNRSRSPGPRASGLWNNVAKGSRQNGGVTWEEALALRAGLGGRVLHFPSAARDMETASRRTPWPVFVRS
jgi:hypothetical protein